MNATSTAQGFPGGTPPAGMQPPNGMGGPGSAGFLRFLGPNASLYLLILLGVTLIVMAAAFWQLYRKAGYSSWTGLLAVVPVVNFGVALYLAFAEWPLIREYRKTRAIALAAVSSGSTGGAGADASLRESAEAGVQATAPA